MTPTARERAQDIRIRFSGQTFSKSEEAYAWLDEAIEAALLQARDEGLADAAETAMKTLCKYDLRMDIVEAISSLKSGRGE